MAGPVGLAVGAAAGAVGGSLSDLDNARVGSDFIDDVSKNLLPKRFAVVAEVEEEWTTPVDTSMQALGGTVFRRALSDVRDTSDAEEVAAMKADFAQMKAGHAKASAGRQAKLTEMNQLKQTSSKQTQKLTCSNKKQQPQRRRRPSTKDKQNKEVHDLLPKTIEVKRIPCLHKIYPTR